MDAKWSPYDANLGSELSSYAVLSSLLGSLQLRPVHMAKRKRQLTIARCREFAAATQRLLKDPPVAER